MSRVHKVSGQKDWLCPIKILILTFLFSWLSFFIHNPLPDFYLYSYSWQKGDSLKFLLIATSKIVKSFQTFPDISTGIGRWHQSDHKHIGLSAVTTGYYQTTMDQGAFMDKIVIMTVRSAPEYPKRKCQKILLFWHFCKETD